MTRRFLQRSGTLTLLLTSALALSAAAAASPKVRIYVVVVAENKSQDPGVPPLRYADDDGVRTYELMRHFAHHASLFVVPDRETAGLHPDAARHAEVPERKAIFARLADYNRRMAKDRRRGIETELFFVYAGHGDVDAGGQGYVSLHDGKLTRQDLYREVIEPSQASFVHVFVDACKSYFLVNSRGKRPWVDDRVAPAKDDSDRRLSAFLQKEELARYPRAGVIVATSGDQETHEWSRYRGGILSHELRSGLAGAADVNGDGKVEYSELLGFFAAANLRVRHARARIDVFSRAPALDRRRPLVDLRRLRAGARRLRFAASLSGRFHVEDDRGLRYADFHKEAGTPFDLVVDAKRTYFVRREDHEEARVPPGTRVSDIASASWSSVAVAARGAIVDSFRRDLFSVAYGMNFYGGYIARSGETPVETSAMLQGRADVEASPHHALSLSYLFGGAAAGSAGPSHGAELRYAYRLLPWLEVGGALEVARGSGVLPNRGGTDALTRLGVLATIAGSWSMASRLALGVDLAAGWQVYDGTVALADGRVTGSEPRGLRLEAAVSLGFRLTRRWSWQLRGGLAVDGVYSAAGESSTKASAFAMTGPRIEF